MMDWSRLLSSTRFRAPGKPDEEQRSVFQRDFDRIVFCAAFRRLQDKTQVHPFPSSDYVRRRLTHSLEVASVGRSLGFWLGTRLANSGAEVASTMPNLAHDVAQIVSNACLAHDIGNPPFGHAGEEAIGSWFKENAGLPLVKAIDQHERADFEKFEGNAQGFRLITRLQNSINAGGLKLTYASLGAFTKYPSTSIHSATGDPYIGAKKYGFFKEDFSAFEEIADTLGLIRRGDYAWCRHPLVFLVEAADDICYKIVDVEDALKLGRVTYSEAEACFVDMLEKGHGYKPEDDEDNNIGWLRAAAIGSLIGGVQQAFEENKAAIMAGTFSSGLLDVIPNAKAVRFAKKLISDRVFSWDRTISAEISGAQMIWEVLDRCMRSADNPDPKINSMIVKIIPRYAADDQPGRKTHTVTDFVSGMTDSYLRTNYLKLTGHAVL